MVVATERYGERGAGPSGWHGWSSLPCTVTCGWCPMPGGTILHLWVVPYAGRNHPALVGGALCRAEASDACGSCPMLGRALLCLCAYAATDSPS